MDIRELITNVVNVSSKIYRSLGSGLYKNVYVDCIVYELTNLGIKVENHKNMPLKYENLNFDDAYKVDLIVEGILVVGIKPLDIPEDVFYKHIETYAKHSCSSTGLILDFNVKDFRAGVRIVEKRASKPVVFPLSYLRYYYNK